MLNIAKIQRLCRDRGVSVAKMEKSVGIANGSIGKWKNSCPSVDNAKAVADYLGVTVDDLLRDDDEDKEE